MINWQHLAVAAAVLAALTALVLLWIRRYKLRKHKDFIRKLETLLQPKETIKVICPQKGSYCILTNKRIIFEKEDLFTAYSLKTLQRIQGNTKEGKKTTVPAKMVNATIRMEQEYLLKNTGAAFEELMKGLQDCLRNRKNRNR